MTKSAFLSVCNQDNFALYEARNATPAIRNDDRYGKTLAAFEHAKVANIYNYEEHNFLCHVLETCLTESLIVNVSSRDDSAFVVTISDCNDFCYDVFDVHCNAHETRNSYVFPSMLLALAMIAELTRDAIESC